MTSAQLSQMSQERPLGLSNPSQPKTPESASQATTSDLPCIVAAWSRNSRETIQVRLDQYKGRNTIDLRTWYPGEDGTLRPGKGLTLSVHHLPNLATALNDALAMAKRMGLLEGGGE